MKDEQSARVYCDMNTTYWLERAEAEMRDLG
jgi:hypothetical protein